MASGVNATVDDVKDDSSSTQPTFPTEVMRLIIRFLREDANTLASAVRINQCFYDIAVPDLNDTVTINKENKVTIGYGHSLPQSMYSKGRLLYMP